ncbi:MAG: hypothetical protein N2D54_04965 [Chloroflexota bacterium]
MSLIIFVMAACGQSPQSNDLPTATQHLAVTPSSQNQKEIIWWDEKAEAISNVLFQDKIHVIYTYSDSQNPQNAHLCLFDWQSESSQTLVISVGEQGQVLDAVVSGDGQSVVYTVMQWEEPLPTLWAVDTENGEEKLIASKEALFALRGNFSRAVPLQLIALSGTTKILFNTTDMSYAGGGINDLQVIDYKNGDLETVLPAGEGGQIRLSLDEKYAAIVGPSWLSVLVLSTFESRKVLSFEEIATYTSDQKFFPRPMWDVDSNKFLIAIPSPLPLESDANLSIYQVDADSGSSSLLAVIETGARVARHVHFSPDRGWVAFTSQENEGHLVREIQLAKIGTQEKIVFKAKKDKSSLVIIAWADDSSGIVYRDGNKYFFGDIHGKVVDSKKPNQPVELQLPNCRIQNE